MTKVYCLGCQKKHQDWAWKYSNEFEGWFCSKYFKPSNAQEFVPERIVDERKEYFNSTVQPYRQGELSKEYVEAHGTKGVNVTPEEADKAKYVWKDLKGWENRKKSK
jgi:hypothetical protein